MYRNSFNSNYGRRKTISYNEYKRRVFNKALLECMSRIHGEVLNGACGECNEQMMTMAKKMSDAFFTDMLKLETNVIGATKKNVCEAVNFIKDAVNVSEEIAEMKAADAKEDNIVITDDQDVELSQEDKAVIDQLFDAKNPDIQIDAIRDATVSALVAEDQKAQEIKDAVDIAKSQVAAGRADADSLEETVNRLNKRGPTSLMNAIINRMSQDAIKDINENGAFTSVGDVLRQSKDEIKTRAVMAYALYETASVFGLHKYRPAEVKDLAFRIYYGE